MSPPRSRSAAGADKAKASAGTVPAVAKEPPASLIAYCKRIGYTGRHAATIHVLRQLQLLHTQTFAFENLSPLLRTSEALDTATLENKMVHSRRGGYCFEQNLLFAHMLELMGFRVVGLAARVLWKECTRNVAPRTHMPLLVDLSGERYVVDVGFGVMTPTAPLHLAVDDSQTTPHESFRLLHQDADLILEVLLPRGWRPLYRFDLQPQHLVDYEITHWYLSHHPESPFVNSLMVARPQPGRRLTLHDNVLTVYTADGVSERRLLTTSAQIVEVLRDAFDIEVPDSWLLHETLTQLIGGIRK